MTNQKQSPSHRQRRRKDKSSLPQSNNYQESQPSRKQTTSEKQHSDLRKYLLACPSVPFDGEAMRLALSVLDDLERTSKCYDNDHSAPLLQSESAETEPSRTGSAATASSTTTAVHNTLKNHHVNNNEGSTVVKTNRLTSIAMTIFRILTVYTPLVSLFLLVVALSSVAHIQTTYLSPRLRLMTFTNERRNTEITYYARYCTSDDVTATSLSSLHIPPPISPNTDEHQQDGTQTSDLDRMMKHGASLYPSVLSTETSTDLRNYILQRNSQLTDDEAIGVIANEHRWSFGIDPNEHPAVTAATKEIANNPQVRHGLEAIMGRNPALTEFTAISTAYQAVDQGWHTDVLSTGSSLNYAQSFVPTYNLFIALQNTTVEMGATEFVPGSHVCSDVTGDVLEKHALSAGEGVDGWWRTGDALLLTQQLYHRGTAHTDPDGPTRVLFIITFAPRPKERDETRIIGIGGSYSLRWDMWGHTLDDLVNPDVSMKQPWATLRSLGLYKPPDADWGWTFPEQISMRIANKDTDYDERGLADWIEDNGGVEGWLLGKRRSWLWMDTEETLLKGTTWEDYLTERVRHWARLVMGITIAVYLTYFFGSLLLGVLFGAIRSVATRKRVRNEDLLFSVCRTTFRVLLIDASIVLLVLYGFLRLSRTHWAMDLHAGRLHQPSFRSNIVPIHAVSRPNTVVTKDDVLVDVRYDSKSLASVSDFLEYHPGNHRFHSVIGRTGPLFSSLRSSDDRWALVRTLVDDAAAASSRFLLRDRGTAYWTVLNDDDTEAYVARELSFASDRLLVSFEKERRSFAAYYREGWLVNTVCGRMGPVLMERVLKGIVERRIPFVADYEEINPFVAGRKRVQSGRMKEGRIIYDDDWMGVGDWNVVSMLKRGLVEDNVYRSEEKNFPSTGGGNNSGRSRPRIMPDRKRVVSSALTEYDVVDTHFEDYWYKAKIYQIRHGTEIDVMFGNGESYEGLPAKEVVPFRPYAVGEAVQAKFDPSKDKWRFAQISGIVSSNSVLVMYGHSSRGDPPEELPHFRIRRFDPKFDVGDVVACQFEEEGWYRGLIVKRRKSGNFDVRFDDGFKKINVRPQDLRGWYWFQEHNL